MRERDLTRADLANIMGVSPGRISQVLSGGENLTLRTLVSLAAALDAHFEVELSPKEQVPADTGDTERPAQAVVESYRPHLRSNRLNGADVSASRRH